MKPALNLIGKRKIWYAISIVAILPGLVSLLLWGLRLGIDFSGGSVSEVQGNVQPTVITQLANQQGFKDVTVVGVGGGRSDIRFRDPAPDAQKETHHQAFKSGLSAHGMQEVSFDVIGPSVSRDITKNAILALVVVSLAIVAYIAFAFRNVPPPVSSWSFGLMAIAALLHDSFFVLGIFSILGHFFQVEVDALFVTAILTVIGFSVHDTIVVFDRIRENLRRYGSRLPFEETVNLSLNETLARSLNTSLTVLFTLLALYLFGGTTIRTFILALLIGIASGTYSSIFNASPLLVTWQNYKAKRGAKESGRLKATRA
jgi:preprotein translocase subunit SecF